MNPPPNNIIGNSSKPNDIDDLDDLTNVSKKDIENEAKEVKVKAKTIFSISNIAKLIIN